MADGDKDPKPGGESEGATSVQKATTTNKEKLTEEPISGDFPGPDQKVGVKDGVFVGDTRYEGTVLVEREVDGNLVTVMTDSPREGDKIQSQSLNTRTGELETSTESSEKAGAARLPGRGR